MIFNFTSLQAARDTGALKEAKDKLEKQLEELTWRLQLEKRLRVMLSDIKLIADIAKILSTCFYMKLNYMPQIHCNRIPVIFFNRVCSRMTIYRIV